MLNLLISLLFSLSASSIYAQNAAQVTQGKAALTANQNIAKTQAMGSTLNILNKGTQTCDADGKNCQSGFGKDDQFNLTRMNSTFGSATGIIGQSFGASDGAGNLSSQTGSLMISCTTPKVHTAVGIAIKVLDCAYDAAGNAAMNYKVCTATSRGFKVSPPDNAVVCSNSPVAPNYKAPLGKVCAAPTCDTEAEGSLNGWTETQTIQYFKDVSDNGTKEEKDANGLKLTLYPNPNKVSASFGSDGESLTALRIAGVTPDVKTKELKLATLIAHRYKRITKNTDVTSRQALPAGQEPPFVETMRKIQNDPMFPEKQREVGKSLTPCIDKIYEGVGDTGNIAICEPNFNKYGIKPVAKTAQVAAMNKACQTTTQCIQELVKTSTHTTECVVDIPLANKNCITTTDFTLEKLEYSRTRPTELCHESRTHAEYACKTEATATVTPGCAAGQPCVAVPSCVVGEVTSINLPDAGGMGNDQWQGADMLAVTWTCTTSLEPVISMYTNGVGWYVVPNGGEVIVTPYGPRMAAKFVNNTTCVMGQCKGSYKLIIGKKVPIFDPRCQPLPVPPPPCLKCSSPTAQLGFASADSGALQICANANIGFFSAFNSGYSPWDPVDFTYVLGYELMEGSFGGATRIEGAGDFSMATLHGIDYSFSFNSCSAYETAK